jgi:hypothetical protein
MAPFEPPRPLTRRQTVEPLQPLDPQYMNDSVEARSQWMASAILHEEMSSLLGSASSQPNANGQQLSQSRPDAAAWQSPMEGRQGYVDRFKATIERDPQQLRAKLSAFQSATARGRAEAKDAIRDGRLDAGPGDRES